MVQANELRMGNIVSANVKNGLANAVVMAILEDGVLLDFVGGKPYGKANFAEIYPVALTTEIFFRLCDFKEYHSNPRLENFYVNNQTYYPFCISTTRDDRFMYNENLQLRYLHQLQNLFFAITGEDLKIQLQENTIFIQGTMPGDLTLKGK